MYQQGLSDRPPRRVRPGAVAPARARLRGRDRLHRPRQLRHEHHRRLAYGYLLVWVLVVSNLMAMLIQYLSAKAGIATGKSLP